MTKKRTKRNTPGMAKNQMRRALRALLDSLPSQADEARLWAYFGSACAYCGQTLVHGERQGQRDHLIAASAGGTNDIHNHVLACGRCNGDEKRELDWQEFLERKVESPLLREERRTRIEKWMQQATPNRLSLDAETQQVADAIIARAMRDFDAAVEEMRALKKAVSKQP